MKKAAILTAAVLLCAALFCGCSFFSSAVTDFIDSRTPVQVPAAADTSGSAAARYTGSVVSLVLPDGVTVDEQKSNHEDGIDFIYMDTPFDGTYITLTASAAPYEGMTWEEGKTMYENFLTSIDAEILARDEMESADYPNELLYVLQTAEATASAGEDLEVETLHIVFLAEDNLCALVGMSADYDAFESIMDMCFDLFDSFALK